MKTTLLLAALLLLPGCVSAPTKPTDAEIASADYGARPTHYREAIEGYFDHSLKDPSSVQYAELTEPTRGFYSIKAAPIHGGATTHYYGWIVRATINAKNSYGGYVGFRTYTFTFRADQIINVDEPVIASAQ